MPNPILESLREIVAKVDAYDTLAADIAEARQDAATAEANLVASEKRYADLVATEAAEDISQEAALAASQLATLTANRRHSDLVAAETAEDVIQNAEIARLTALVNSAPAPTSPPVTPVPVPVSPPPVTTTPTPTTNNLILRGNKIFRSTGQQVIARGPEKTIADANDTDAVNAVAATGANAMRLLLTVDAANGMTPARFDAILARAAFHRMIVWVSLYTWNDGANNRIGDSLGGGNFYNLNGGSREQPADCYLGMWQRQWLKDLMNKYRDIVIIDAAQEYKAPPANGVDEEQNNWALSAEKAIRFFRQQGYTQPLEIMANWQGRDLSGIIRLADRIRAADTVVVGGQPQTMFGWQAYWGTADGWYPKSQGDLLLGGGRTLTAVQAMTQFVDKATYPIQLGFDNYESDTNADWRAQVDAAATLGQSWLWWSWRDNTIESHVGGQTARTYVLSSANGFKGSVKS